MATRAERLAKLRAIQNPDKATEDVLAFLSTKIQPIEVEIPLPEKGEDYFTEEDIQQIVSLVRELVKDGEQGEKGEQGPQGEKGPQGEMGPSGKNGRDGETPDIDKIIKDVLSKIPKTKEISIEDILKKIPAQDTKDFISKDELTAYLKRGGYRGGGASFLTQLGDISLSNVSNNQVLKYNSTTQKWENGTASGGIESIVAGTNVTVDNTDPLNPIVSANDSTGTPAVSVTDETTYGITPAVGVSTNYARQDHTHGSMTTPTKTTVGLANVDNTSDASKPVSTATQTALDLKRNVADLPLKLQSVAITGQVADITDTAMSTTGAGIYKLSYYMLSTAVDITAGAVSVNFKFTDDSLARTFSSSPVVLTSTAGIVHGDLTIRLASGSLTYGVTHTGIYGTSAYALYIILERLN